MGTPPTWDAPDFLEYLAQDTGNRYNCHLCRRCERRPGIYVCCPEMPGKKPVVILGAGTTENGAPRRPSHTAFSSQWSQENWKAFFKTDRRNSRTDNG